MIKIPGKIDDELIYLFNRLDYIVAVVGTLSGLSLILLGFISRVQQQYLGFTIFCASLIYLILRNWIKKESILNINYNIYAKPILNFIFAIVFLLNTYIWYTNLYFRPTLYFILTSFLTGIIAVEILYLKEKDPIYPVLVKIFILSIWIMYGIFYNFTSIMGYDAYIHAQIAETISNTGYVPPIEVSGKYIFAPIVHIFISLVQTVCNLNIKDAIFCSISLATVFSTIFIYLVGTKLAGRRIGLLATLLANVTNFIIVSGVTNVTPGSLVLCYFALLLYLILINNKVYINMAIVIIITFIMIITHQLTTFVVLISLIIIYVSNILNKLINKTNINLKLNMFYIILFSSMLLFDWSITSTYPDTSFLEAVVSPLTTVAETASQYGPNQLVTGYEYHRTLLDTILLQSCYLVLPFLAISGILSCLSEKNINRFSYAFTGIALYLFEYGIPLMGIINFLTSRWMPLHAILLVIFSSIYIYKIIGLTKSNVSKIFIVFIIIFIYTFFMIITPSINRDNLLVGSDTTCRNQFKASEIDAVLTISSAYNGPIILDSPYYSCYYYETRASLNKELQSTISVFDTGYIENLTGEPNKMILVRQSTIDEPVLWGTFYAPLPESFFERYRSTKYDLIYNGGGIYSYFVKNS